MVDAINIPAQVTASNISTGSQDAPTPALEPLETSGNSLTDFTISNIRLDNTLDLVILEFRSFETGDVIRQFPTEGQIQQFERVAELENSITARQEFTSEFIEGGSAPLGAANPVVTAADQAAGFNATPETGPSPAPLPEAPAPSANTDASSPVNFTAGTPEQLSDTSSVSTSSTQDILV